MSQAADHAADSDKSVEIAREFGAIDVARMAGRIGERHAILVEIVGHRKLTAERISPACNVDLVDFVVARLQQDRDAETRLVDEFGNRDLVAEVRQTNDQPVDHVALVAKMRGVETRVLSRLHGSVLRRLDREDAIADTQPIELRDQLLAGLESRSAVEEFTTADDEPELDLAQVWASL